MTDKYCYKQAIIDYIELCNLLKGKNYEDCIATCKELSLDWFNANDERFDVNYGTACFTIERNKDNQGIVNPNSIEVWNDSKITCLGNYTLKELEDF